MKINQLYESDHANIPVARLKKSHAFSLNPLFYSIFFSKLHIIKCLMKFMITYEEKRIRDRSSKKRENQKKTIYLFNIIYITLQNAARTPPSMIFPSSKSDSASIILDEI